VNLRQGHALLRLLARSRNHSIGKEIAESLIQVPEARSVFIGTHKENAFCRNARLQFRSFGPANPTLTGSRNPIRLC
jgi:hypothetical protein